MKGVEPVVGHWWIPGGPADPAFGTLRREGAGWQLEIGQALAEVEADALDSVPSMETIHGVAVDGGTHYTLGDCFVSSASVHPRYPREGWVVNEVLEGFHLDATEAAFDRMLIRSPALLEWLGRGSQAELAFSDSGFARITAEPEMLGEAKVADASVVVKIDHEVSQRGSETTVERFAAFEVRFPEPLGHRDGFERWARPLVDLVEFAANGFAELEPVVYVRIDESGRSENLTHHHRFSPPDRPEPLCPSWEMLLPPRELGRPVGELIEDWLRLREVQNTAITTLLIPDRSSGQYGEMLMLTAFNALEAYQEHRFGRDTDASIHDDRVERVVASSPPDLHEWVGHALKPQRGKGIRVRFDEVFEWAGGTGATVAAAVPKLRKRALDARHKVVHASKLDPLMATEYVILERAVRWLVRHCLLRDLGWSDDAATERVASSRRFRQDLNLFRSYGE